MPAVSVIVPTYNRGGYLKRALASIAAQDYRDYEVIVCNDGGENMENIVTRYDNARYVEHKINKGLPAARNTAIRAARGKYIAYLDDDDVWYPHHLTVCMGRIGRLGRRYVYTDCHFWYDEDDAKKKLEMSRDFSREELQRHNLTPVICVMHERALLDECGWFDESLPNHEDYDLWLRFAEKIEFHHIPVVTGAYSKRSEGGQITTDTNAMMRGWRFVRERHKRRMEEGVYEGVL